MVSLIINITLNYILQFKQLENKKNN